MQSTRKKPQFNAELSDADFMSAEVDNLISSAEVRIAQQRLSHQISKPA